jgi:hypothetical protein
VSGPTFRRGLPRGLIKFSADRDQLRNPWPRARARVTKYAGRMFIAVPRDCPAHACLKRHAEPERLNLHRRRQICHTNV